MISRIFLHFIPESWWEGNATIEDWFDEMVGQANIINRFGGIKMEDIRGIRVPCKFFFKEKYPFHVNICIINYHFFGFSHKISDLKPGWNRQFLMMKEFGFVYDSSIPAPLSDPPLWPYTLDYKIPHKCIGRRKCPSRSFPGIWVNNFF